MHERLRPVLDRLRRHVRKLWDSRGGGFYGFVATLTFLYLEIIDLAGDLAGVRLRMIDLGWVIGFLVDNMVEAITFMVSAALWPVAWLEMFGLGLTSGLLLAAAYGGYRAVRPTVRRWLAEPDELETIAAAPGGAEPGA